MTIATLILTCLIFVGLGWTGDAYAPVALCVGAIVCIAAANAGTTSQDLKTGYIVGATPLYQQIGLIIGVLASASIIGMTTLYMHQVFGIGSARRARAAGHADVDDHHGPAQPEPALGARAGRASSSRSRSSCAASDSLSFAVGSLPADRHDGADLRRRPRALVGREKTGQRRNRKSAAGTLFSSGLIAGGSIAGILFAIFVGTGSIAPIPSLGTVSRSFTRSTLGSGRRAALPGAGLDPRPHGDAQSRMSVVRGRTLAVRLAGVEALAAP